MLQEHGEHANLHLGNVIHKRCQVADCTPTSLFCSVYNVPIVLSKPLSRVDSKAAHRQATHGTKVGDIVDLEANSEEGAGLI
jgi:hypothetical protein